MVFLMVLTGTDMRYLCTHEFDLSFPQYLGQATSLANTLRVTALIVEFVPLIEDAPS